MVLRNEGARLATLTCIEVLNIQYNKQNRIPNKRGGMAGKYLGGGGVWDAREQIEFLERTRAMYVIE
jgi:hypothetical protein